ncbi:hypothetical protein JAO73_11875 [Hymenobacter sp. BT523]|uniref:hypothetical protein n=1 Tax=Hymenobacter sp. BT523 TaxID=2795725 RepID=UPI0018EACABD|nr:hypothetical protein [Hymenobacter sp. BT523]MBJ6109715.1 hypothetical protein [Hymenobacter sp. BT523]
MWDEARLAVNATEILQSGDWLITRYDGQPDLWNTKPPLFIWLQAGFNGTHVARFGDYDAVLTLALTATALQWYRYAHDRQTKQLWRGAAWLGLALLT